MGAAKLTGTVNGPAIRKTRERAGMSVADFVDALAKAGVRRHPDTLRNIELGHSRPGLELFYTIVRVLHVDYEDLLVDQDDHDA